MELEQKQWDQLDLVIDWKIDVVPMMGAAVFTFRSLLMDANVRQDTTRDSLPMAFPIDRLRALSATLQQLLATMDQMGVPDMRGPGTGQPQH